MRCQVQHHRAHDRDRRVRGVIVGALEREREPLLQVLVRRHRLVVVLELLLQFACRARLLARWRGRQS
jgi:hypothetical protein